MAVSIHSRTLERTSPANVCPFRSLLLMVDDGLTKEDLEKMIFLCKDLIGSERETEDIRSGRDLFDILIKRDVINKTCIDYLSDLLAKIRRFDVRKELCRKWDALKHKSLEEMRPPFCASHLRTIHTPQVPKVHMNQRVSPQQQTQEHASINLSRKNHPWLSVSVLKIEGNDVDYNANDGEWLQGKANQQRKKSGMLSEMQCQGTGGKDETLLDSESCIRHSIGKRPHLIRQKCVELGSSENVHCPDADGVQCVFPCNRPSDNDKRNHLMDVGSHSSTISLDSLEEQKTGNNFLLVRSDLSRGSSIESYGSTFSADSLEEPKTVKSTLSVRPGLRLSPRSSFDSDSSSLSTDSLEEHNSLLLEPYRALKRSVGF